MPKTIEKPKAKKTVEAKEAKSPSRKNGKVNIIKTPARNGTPKKLVVNKTPAVGKTEFPNKVKKGAEPVATSKKKKAPAYAPTKNSMRFFVMEALTVGVASANKVKQRAAKLAGKAGIKKYAEVDSYKGFDVTFFVKMLEERGVKIERDGEKFGIA